MEEEKNNGENRGAGDSDAEAEDRDYAGLIAAGPGGGNRAGGLALLAVAVIVAGVFHYHFSAGGSDAFLAKLDSELLTHAELALVSRNRGDESGLAVVPSWPLRLYASLRHDIAVYVCLALLVAWLWSLSSRSRAKRDAYLVQRRLSEEIACLRRRLDQLSGSVLPSNDKVANDSRNRRPVSEKTDNHS